jgi:hypothetical protein
MPVRMTETAISKAMREVANGTRRDLADSGCPGLRLRLTPGGTATWVLACRDRHGRMRRFPLGDTLRLASVMLAAKLGNFTRASGRKAPIRRRPAP